MSKSKGNVVNPDDIVRDFGADTLRVYEMFMGPFDQDAAWSMESIRGCSKFLDRVWNLQNMLTDGEEYRPETEKMMHKAVKKVTKEIEEMKYNTCISTFMTLMNEFTKLKSINRAEFYTFMQLLNPFAPHLTEELNEIAGNENELAYSEWPSYDEEKTIEDIITLPVQINGKLRANIEIEKDEEEKSIKEKVHKNEKIIFYTEGKQIVKEIYVTNRIYNIVVK